MLKKLKRRFVLASMLALSIVLAVIIGAINAFNYRSIVIEADQTLALLMLNEGKFPPPAKPEIIMPGDRMQATIEMPYESRFFTVKFSSDGETAMVDTSSIAAIDEEEAEEMAEFIVDHRGERGFMGQYRFAVDRSSGGTRVIFLDCKRSLDNVHTFLLLSLLMSGAGLMAVLMLLIIFADKIVKPISESYEKQKQFITNAGHDIKTPITIIDADAELLEMDVGDNEWLADIKKQTKRLSTLTSELIYLSRMEETASAPHIDFPLGDVAEDVIRSFGAPAKSKNIVIEADIPASVSCVGDEEAIRKLLTILFDNAIKYSPEGECVRFSIKKHNRGTQISISNTAEELSDEAVKHMFDRFYRSDSARSSSGGFGIGLSVACAIVASHKGKISASKVRNTLVIDIVL